MKNKIYAAYGSNMNLKQMKRRCPKAKVIGTGEVRNYKLTFRGTSSGVANIEESSGGAVPIVLWEITKECEKALDIYEGYPKMYVKKDIEVVTKEGTVTAMAYVMAKEYEKLPAEPVRYYVDVIRQGYTDNKIPADVLMEAVDENIKELKY
ncbi:gamma-glutamylcyclotransferase family protein [Clostridium kluyveri]|uniref:gamma-glutamylcyclotransferase family protein n=1 Tax=Clostridium kluyveri TaxID=1534 RepID=UPI0022481C2A|nr:gamma-glutamylcyclotransferase family protein [Clostridium kluyveri]UZQ49917.1 gamma-glutamylcyclotransferase [Clostridium kluyveri]